MILDLKKLPYPVALTIIEYCFQNNIDRENCVKMIEASSYDKPVHIDWTIDIPDKHVTMILLKFGHAL